MIKDRSCQGRSWKKEELEAVVDYEVRNLIFDQDALSRLISKKEKKVVAPDDQQTTMANKIEHLDKQIERIMDLYQDGSIPVEILNERVKKLYSEREQLASALAEVVVTPTDEMSHGDIREYLDSVSAIWDLADVDQKREILSVLIDKIYVGADNRVEIKWTFA
jgi:site-specific DNA recombinase